MLSEPFDAGEEVIGLPPSELKAAAAEIQSGRGYTFDPQVLAKVRAEHEATKAITPRRLILDAVQWLGPPLMLLALGFWFISRK